MLHGQDLQQSVISKLGPAATSESVPLIALTQNADVGGKFWLLSVPYSCTGILSALEQYKATNADLAQTLTIQPTAINSRIFAQSILSAVPMAAYAKLAEYERAYLNPFGNHGKHLYMGEEENWENLPCPIPWRSRPPMEDAYPPAVKAREDEQRELFRKCRKARVICSSDNAIETVYELYCSKLPDLEEFREEELRDESGRPDPARIKDAIEKLEDWLETGLPSRTEGAYDVCYTVANCPIPSPGEPDEREIVACECFLGQYNNIRRAREELEKYEKVQSKLGELNVLSKDTGGF